MLYTIEFLSPLTFSLILCKILVHYEIITSLLPIDILSLSLLSIKPMSSSSGQPTPG